MIGISSCCKEHLVFVTLDGAIARYDCAGCGGRFIFHTTPPPARVHLQVKWKDGQPTSKEVASLRSLSEEAASLSPAALLKRARKGDWDLGLVSGEEARAIRRRAAELGLTIESSAIDE